MNACAPSPTPSAWRTFWIASAAVFLVPLDTTAVVAAYAPLPAHFIGVSVAELSWTLNAYTVLFAAQPITNTWSGTLLAGGHWLAPALRQRLQQGFGAHGPVDASMGQLLDLSQIISGRIWSEADNAVRAYVPTVPYPENNPISTPLMTIAQTLKLGMGTRVATVDVPG